MSASTVMLACFGVLLVVTSSGCTCADSQDDARPGPTSETTATASAPLGAPKPQELFIPDASPVVGSGTPPLPALVGSACPAEMVSIRGQFCIDRFESSLVDVAEERPVSPYYHPTYYHTRSAFKIWENERFNMGSPEHQNLPLPPPPRFQLEGNFDVKAVVRRGVPPNGYISGVVAERACRNAGKRLCTEVEWVTACKGEREQKYPYGDEYQHGKCNVKMGRHPAAILHGNASIGHLDPRLNHFSHRGRSLLHPTGTNPECSSRWGEDAVYDMVGNLDEWVDDEEGVFLGGFYARSTVEGCDSKISSHPRAYFDYSLGIRCCK